MQSGRRGQDDNGGISVFLRDVHSKKALQDAAVFLKPFSFNNFKALAGFFFFSPPPP